jgi:hypothetical protein
MYSNYIKKRKISKLEKIDEDSIFIEKQVKYNEYNQINIIEKIYDLYNKLIKTLIKHNSSSFINFRRF